MSQLGWHIGAGKDTATILLPTTIDTTPTEVYTGKWVHVDS